MGNILMSGITTVVVRGLLSDESLDEIINHTVSDESSTSLLTANEEECVSHSDDWEILFM